MSIKLKRKYLILSGLVVGTSLVSSVTGSVLYNFSPTSSSDNSSNLPESINKPVLENINHTDITAGISSAVDLNLPKPKEKVKKIDEPTVKTTKKVDENKEVTKTKETVILNQIEKPKPIEKPELKQVPEKKKDEPKPETKQEIKKSEPASAQKIKQIVITPPKEDEKKELPIAQPPKQEVKKQENFSPKQEQSNKIYIQGVPVDADVTQNPGRTIAQYDVERDIANRRPYSQEINKVLNSITVTDQLTNRVLSNAIAAFKTIHDNPNDTIGFIKQIFDDKQYKTETERDANIQSYINQQPGVWEKKRYQYSRLIDSPNIKYFLKNPADYEKFKNYPDKTVRDWLLIENIDFSKFTQIDPSAYSELQKGFVLDPREIYITEDGKINSHAFGQPDEFNSVLGVQTRDNETRRTFRISGPFGRDGDSILSGNYKDWNKTDIKYEARFAKYDIQGIKGINIYKLTAKQKVDGQLNEGTVLEINMFDSKAYAKTKELLEGFKKDNINITSYRFLNMGAASANQKFKEILDLLPQKIPQLELFFDASAANTSALIELEYKEIDELGLYTTGNALSEKWSINPLALRKTAWVNTLDYNVSRDYPANSNIATRIVFDSLAFEESDIKKNTSDPYSRINDGLRMAYWTRNNEKIFEGQSGGGNHPDNNESGNSYPLGLDFSRAPSIRSLHGLVFSDVVKTSNAPRKIKRLLLFNDSEYFNISSKELNDAGFENIAKGEPGPPDAKIIFSNNNTTKYVYLTGSDQLTSRGLGYLKDLFDLAKQLNKTTIYVQPQAIELKKQLESNGYTVAVYSQQEDDLTLT
ncbi:putative immunoglobulin-blocking virulence protein [Mycoplasma sp. 6243]|uniref:putative immunoglobulin-blocking virulence protein n=1 Tax=Mycoplasma sp. 6243 TaxID=3440865 RepID=UPI003EBC81EE